jgi:hypothetical protein
MNYNLFNNLNDDILIELIQYLDNTSSLNFILTSKYFSNLFCKYGFAKYLNIKSNQSPFILMDRYIKHYRTLKMVTVNNCNNPQHWIFGNWAKEMYFFDCNFNDTIKNKNNFITEKLYITSRLKKQLKINWKNFPNLKKIKLEIDDIDLNEIENCKKLEIIFLNIKNKNKKIDICQLNKLTNLKLLITNNKQLINSNVNRKFNISLDDSLTIEKHTF